MWLAITKFATNTDDEHCAMFLTNSVLTLFRCHIRIHLTQLFRMNEENVFRKEWLDLWIGLTDIELGTENRAIDLAYNLLEELYVSFALGNDTLPIPLIDIERVKVVELLIGTNSIHIGNYAIAMFNLILCQCHALPLCE